MKTTLLTLAFLVLVGHVAAQGYAGEKYFGIGITGDTTDVTPPTQFGVAMVGGSTDVDEAIQWMIKLSGGGDFIIIRASGSTGYNDYIKELGEVNSVETLLIDSREKALSEAVGTRIRQAEAVFIAGGDQWNYINYWSNTPVSEALIYLIHKKKVPIGGTSAGCAVLGNLAFDARKGTVISNEALLDPFIATASLSKSFIQIPVLKNTITDQHYTQRSRHGRHLVFMARLILEENTKGIKGIGIDEKTAVCIDALGNAIVFGKNQAYFLVANTKPQTCQAKNPLHWVGKQGKGAVSAFIYSGSAGGTAAFNLNRWPTKNATQSWSVTNGILKE